jgi:DNA-binding LacI/PurR family transcriptional regulator
LTVLNVRLNEMAGEAGHLLAKMLRGDPVERHQRFLSPILEEHGSTGPPPVARQ